MLITRLRLPAAAVLCALALLPLHASSPKFFQAATQNDFLRGDVENLSIDSHGQLTLRASVFLGHKLVSQQAFSVKIPSHSADAAGGARALADAADKVAQDMLVWLNQSVK